MAHCDRRNLTSVRYRQSVSSLAAVDVSGDGFKDLVVSDGVIFINNRPDPNWAPTVDAGQGGTINGHQVTLRAIADDVDQDKLTYSWSTTAGITLPPLPTQCVTVPNDGTFRFDVTVDDGHGHRATASVVYTFTGGERQPNTTITAPTAGSVIAAGQPFTIRWTMDPGSFRMARIDLEFTTDDERSPRTPIAECQNLSPSASSCV